MPTRRFSTTSRMPHAVGAAQLIELFDDLHTVHLLRRRPWSARPVRNGCVTYGRLHPEPAAGIRPSRGSLPFHSGASLAGSSRSKSLMREVPQVLILGIVGLRRDLQRDIVRLRIFDLLFPGIQFPETPWRDDVDFRRKCLDGQLKAYLVIALSSAAVADSVGAFLLRDLHDALGDQRTREARCPADTAHKRRRPASSE